MLLTMVFFGGFFLGSGLKRPTLRQEDSIKPEALITGKLALARLLCKQQTEGLKGGLGMGGLVGGV